MASPSCSEDDEESIYNDGHGLQFTVELTLQLPVGKKKRKNAKPVIVKKSFYVHEDSKLNNLLFATIKAFDCEDDLSFCWIPRENKYTSSTINILGIKYTIPRTQFKDISLSCTTDYDILLKEAMKKAVPETIKIYIAELESHEEENEDSSEDEGGCEGKKKKKTFEPSAEEIEINELIAQLNAEWKCENRGCKQYFCFPDRQSAKHVPLTHLHSTTWAIAIQGKVTNADGMLVDLKNPPDSKLFDYQDPDSDDQALLHGQAAQRTTIKDSNIIINLTLPKTVLPPLPPSHHAPP
ncbi:hypothetical protein C8R44DRAFT_884826 [Mycena epipterygia]|nr:hypothetical protein C8R44DRAFT_884826 [Mycena epipterygia]